MNRNLLLFMFLLLTPVANAQKINESSIDILGVQQTDEGMEGVVAHLTIEVHNGEGRVFLDTLPLTEVDTQASARLARDVACDSLNLNCGKYDFFYIIRSDVPILGGPSAGAAMTVATMSALTGLNLNNNIYLTGTVNPDGTIGPVGGIFEKAQAANNASADMLLIPSGQAEVFIEKITSNQIGPFATTSIETVPVNIISYASENWNFQVKEARTVEEAFAVMTGFEINKTEILSEEIASQLYLDAMKEIAVNLIRLNDEYSVKVKQSLAQEQDIQELIDNADSSSNRSKELFESGSYYSSASFSVTAALNNNYANLLRDYHERNSDADFVLHQLNDAEVNITSLKNQLLNDRFIDDINDIEAILIAIDRMREAEVLFEEGKSFHTSGRYEDALFNKAFIDVRLQTAYNWANITEKFSSTEPVELKLSNLQPLAVIRLQEAQNYLSYAQTITSSSFTQQAVLKLEEAEKDFADEKFVSALFKSLESRAYANLAMETRGMSNDTLYKKTKDDYNEVNLAIKDAQNEGLITLLSLSYVEYAKAFEATEPAQTLIFLSYAKQFSELSKDLIKYTLSDGEGILPAKPYTISPYKSPDQVSLSVQITLLIIGLCIGILLSTIRII